jgi:hypothetical protein
MKSQKLITALLLMAPAAAWADIPVPEPSVLPLLAIGGVAVLAVKFMRRNK